MICQSYEEMTPRERQEFIGKLIHAATNSEGCFVLASDLIRIAEFDGVFKGVVINPIQDMLEEKELEWIANQGNLENT